jgi:cell division transport system permease protein
MTQILQKPGSIVPTGAAPLRTLTAVMAVMCFLAVLAVGAMLLINRAVAQWASGLSSEVTVQLPQLSTRDMDKDLALLAKNLSETKGVKAVTVLERSAGEELLAPWIGTDGLDALPIPRLIRVVVDDQTPPDFVSLEEKLTAAVPTARLDTHRRWEAELRRMASTLTLLSSLILALISISAIAMVIFASRAVLEANRGVVEVLHIAGADDNFIAGEINRRFLVSGFMAGVMGLAGGLLTFFALGHWGFAENNGVASAARGLFFLPQEGDWRSLSWFLLVPLAATVIALITSRLSLKRMLGEVS